MDGRLTTCFQAFYPLSVADIVLERVMARFRIIEVHQTGVEHQVAAASYIVIRFHQVQHIVYGCTGIDVVTMLLAVKGTEVADFQAVVMFHRYKADNNHDYYRYG
jgi:hypothetical protein